jgi:glycosyltransferase involved in cell wall biosynthesis
MSTTTSRAVRVLELRSVRGTGGGPEKTILLGAAMADPARAHVTVCYLRDQRDGIFKIHERAAAVGIDYVEVSERHSFDPSVWRKLRGLIAERRIDILHAHDYKTNLLALLLARAAGVRALSTVHGWTGQSPRERYCYYPADKRVLARFPRLIAVSTDIARELVHHGADRRRVTTILNAIDHRQFHRDPARVAGARAALGLEPHHIAIGAVGRLEPQKRFDLLLEAFAVLHIERPELRLIIAGDGSLAASLDHQRQALGLADSVILTGHVTDVIPLHHAFDLFVQSSDYEGTSNAVLEAMALEAPIVATAIAAVSEAVVDGEHALLVPPDNPEALAAAVVTALRSPQACRERALAALARFHDHFTITQAADGMLRFYEAALSI